MLHCKYCKINIPEKCLPAWIQPTAGESCLFMLVHRAWLLLSYLVVMATPFLTQALLLSRESMKRATSPLPTALLGGWPLLSGTKYPSWVRNSWAVAGRFLRPGGRTTVQLMSSVFCRNCSISYMLLRTLRINGSRRNLIRYDDWVPEFGSVYQEVMVMILFTRVSCIALTIAVMDRV